MTIVLPARRPPAGGAIAVPGPAAPTAPNVLTGIAAYAGKYGDRTVSVVDGKLFIQRPNGQALELTSTGPDAFTIVGIPEAKIEFTRDAGGTVIEIRVFNQQRQWERVNGVSPALVRSGRWLKRRPEGCEKGRMAQVSDCSTSRHEPNFKNE